MKGQPKYKVGDKVIITNDDVNSINYGDHIGEVYIVDPFGTWDDPSDVSYDIMIEDYRHPSAPDKPSKCLCKHYTEKLVKPYVNNK